jgi:16S rRNA (guanine(966)-N(2))-methyltransferase RsmD
MRVIAGQFRSRRLKSVPGLNVRPTPDRLRETLFNVLAPEIEDAVFLDAYAGSGAVAIEALSRGARHAILFEKSNAALAVIYENLKALGLSEHATVIRGNALSLLPRHPAGIVFLDPPYSRPSEYQSALDLLAAASTPLVIAQHELRLDLPDQAGSLRKTRVIRQGSNALSFFRMHSEPEPHP